MYIGRFFFMLIGLFIFNQLFFFDEELIISFSFCIIFFNLFFLLSDVLKKYLDKISFSILKAYIDYYNLYLMYNVELKKFHKIRNRKEFILSLMNFYLGFFLFYINLVLKIYLNDRNLKVDEVFLNLLIKIYKNEFLERRTNLEKYLYIKDFEKILEDDAEMENKYDDLLKKILKEVNVNK